MMQFQPQMTQGKSLSLICGALKWIEDNASRHENIIETQISVNDDGSLIYKLYVHKFHPCQ